MTTSKPQSTPDTELILQRFGKYLLLDHLVDGGMAKICRARFLGEQADKIVAIKMIQAQYSKKPSFKQMFMDEIKVTFGLNHPNIAQTYDYGLLDDQLFTAMEYVDGKNLKEFVEKLKSKKFVFPVEISTYIISQVCQALTYAHNFTDNLTGKKLHIIHRDISPHNIMLTYDGTIKVIDFGIAKAETNAEETQVGTIKGKISYIAPEYIDGLELDHRYDQFAVGLTLWEMLCNRKLFQAPNELNILKKIQQCIVPLPSSINPKVPKELDAIVLKSLSKNRNDRYDNMEQFNRALIKFLYSTYPEFNSTDLKYFAHDLYKDEIQKDKLKMVEFGKVDISSYIQELKNNDNSSTEKSKPVTTVPTAEGIDIDFGNQDQKTKTIVTPAAPVISPITKVAEKKEIHPRIMDENSDSGLTIDYEYTKKIEKSAIENGIKKPHLKNTKAQTEDEEQAQRKKNLSHRNRKSLLEALFKNKSFLKYAIPVSIFLFIFLFRGFFIPSRSTPEGAHIDIPNDSLAIKEAASLRPKIKSINKVIDKEKKVRINLIGVNAFQKLYVNNKPAELFNISSLMVPFNKKVILRVEEERKRPLFIPILITENNPDEIPEITLPAPSNEATGLFSPPPDMPTNSMISLVVDDQKVEYTFPMTTQTLPVGFYKATIFHATKKISKEIEFQVEENKITRLRF